MKSIILIAALLSLPASAQEVLVIGAGGHSCGKWLESRNNVAVRMQYQQWVFGFVSGSNWNSDSEAKPLDSEALVAFVDSYCANNPLHPLSGAAAAAIQETGGPKVQHEWHR